MNSWESLKPLRIEANSTGFTVRNMTDLAVVVAWDKVQAGRKYEVVVSCPACSRKIRMRSGLLGKVAALLPLSSPPAAHATLRLSSAGVSRVDAHVRHWTELDSPLSERLTEA